MQLLFTNGVTGYVREGTIYLRNINQDINTNQSYMNENYEYNIEAIKMIESSYGIKLMGENPRIREFEINNGFNLFWIHNDSVLEYSYGEFGDSIRIELYDSILASIFNDVDEYYMRIGLQPIFMTTEGLTQELLMSRQGFQNSLVNSPLLDYFDEEYKYKMIYLHDIHSILDDLSSTFLTVESQFINASMELTKVTQEVVNSFNKSLDDFEIGNDHGAAFYGGLHADLINSNFMNVIFRMTSTLDIISKLAFEIVSIPSEYKGYIRFSSNGKYFSNLRQLNDKFSKLKNYNESFFGKYNYFHEIVNIRNTIAHNMFLTSNPKVNMYLAQNNSDLLLKSVIYLWDIDENGNAERWLNRCRFYSNKTCIQEYLLARIIEFRNSFYSTISLFNEYLNNEHIV